MADSAATTDALATTEATEADTADTEVAMEEVTTVVVDTITETKIHLPKLKNKNLREWWVKYCFVVSRFKM